MKRKRIEFVGGLPTSAPALGSSVTEPRVVPMSAPKSEADRLREYAEGVRRKHAEDAGKKVKYGSRCRSCHKWFPCDARRLALMVAIAVDALDPNTGPIYDPLMYMASHLPSASETKG